MRYRLLTLKKERDEAREIGKRLAKYLFDNKIERIMFTDRSARPAYVALIGAWRNLYPGLNIPQIYFTNPEGHNTNSRNAKEVMKEFDSTYKRLAVDKKSPLMLFDVCMHTGETLAPVLKTLKRLGYENVKVGISQPKEKNCAKKVAFEALRHEPKAFCYPFGRDYMIEKSRTSVLSDKNQNRGDIKHSVRLRRELASLFD